MRQPRSRFLILSHIVPPEIPPPTSSRGRQWSKVNSRSIQLLVMVTRMTRPIFRPPNTLAAPTADTSQNTLFAQMSQKPLVSYRSTTSALPKQIRTILSSALRWPLYSTSGAHTRCSRWNSRSLRHSTIFCTPSVSNMTLFATVTCS